MRPRLFRQFASESLAGTQTNAKKSKSAASQLHNHNSRPILMELLASGHNAWGQLDFANSNPQELCVTDDVHEFRGIVQGRVIKQVQAFLSYTRLSCDGVICTAGHCPRRNCALYEQYPEAQFTFAEASNGSAAMIDQSGLVVQFQSLQVDGMTQGLHVADLPSCTQVVAYDTGFAALTSAGDVYTWGDERYGACLGRDISEASPAEKPGLVTALKDLPTGPISKLAAGGYMLAALTAGNDLYLWGGHPGRKTVPTDISEDPTPVVIDEQDVADVALGEAHIIVLTTGGKVYVIGQNSNGQLGLSLESTDSWMRVDLNLSKGKRAVGVAAGPRNSFIIIREG